MAARGFLGAGDLYIARYNPTLGDFDEFKGPFESKKFEIKPNSELKEMSSKGRGSYGQVIESVPLPQPSDFTVELSEVNKDSLIMALLGTSSAINQGSGTVTDEAVNLAKDAWVPLSKQNIAEAGFAVNVTAGGALLVLGTDYAVNYRMGWIKLLAGSAQLDGVAVLVDFTYNAVTGTKIKGATQSQVRAKFRLDGVNFADQLPVLVDVWEAVLSSDSAFDFLGDDFATINLQGRLKTPADKTEPFEVNLLDA